MLQASCPNCSQTVRQELDCCPACGSNISFAVGEDETQDVSIRKVAFVDFKPGETFAGRFTIIEKTGAGGMGVVYKAIDTELDTLVALKLIQPVLACSRSNVERFRREVRMTRQITHTNICRIHDIGNAEGVMFLSMEWIEGDTLQQLLRKTGMLRESRALEIAQEIAGALAAAHAVGIVHRDLKPANVMVGRRGRIHVLDFGLAIEQGLETVTIKGRQVGTPLYMSPEQRAGEAVDERTDLYALGLILLEMLTGNRAHPEALRIDALGEQINPLIVPVLQRLLASQRAARYESAETAARELQDLIEDPAISSATITASGREIALVSERKSRRRRWIVAASLFAVVAATVTFSWIWTHQAPATEPELSPFYYRGLHYLREESEYLRSLDTAINMFHRALNREPDSALVLATLAEAYWMRFERTLQPGSREEAERALSKAIALDPDLAEVRYSKALGFIVEGKYEAARSELEQALAAKPDFTMAWINLGVAWQNLGDYSAGKAAFERAIQLEPDSFRAQIYFGNFYESFQEFETALGYYRKATELKPNSGTAWNNLGAASLLTSRFDEAIPAFRHSIEIEDNADARSNLGTSYFFSGDFDKAVENYERATELRPREAVHWGNLGDGLQAQGRTEEAHAANVRAAELALERVTMEPLNVEALMEVAVYCAKVNDPTCARQHGSRAIDLQPENADVLFRQALVLCMLKEDDEALDLLDRAVRLGAGRAQIEAIPEFSRYADHPRFKTILGLAS